MHGHKSEILTTTFLMLSAVSFCLILRWLKQPPLVGYILAGLALGPAGLGLVDYSNEISSLAKFGVLVAQDIAVVPLLVWIGKTARQRLPMAMLLEGNVELAILFSLGICFLAASVTGYIELSHVFSEFCAGLALSHTNLR